MTYKYGCEWERGNKGCCYPHDLVFFDTETVGRNPTPGDATPVALLKTVGQRFIGGHAQYLRLEKGKPTRESALSFTDPEEFWHWLAARSRKNSLLWCFALNAAFDLTQIGTWTKADKYEIVFTGAPPLDKETGEPLYYDGRKGMYLTADPPTALDVWHTRHERKYRFVDVFNYFRESVSKLGEWVGLPKVEEVKQWQSWSEAEPRCVRDVEIIRAVMLRLIEWWVANDLGTFRVTAPGLAKAAFRHKFKQHRIRFHQHPELRKLERAAYCGNQMELYRHGKVEVTVNELDMSAMYPSIMKRFPLPSAVCEYRFVRQDQATDPIALDGAGIAHVLIRSDQTEYPKKTKRGTYYPLGTFWTVLAGPELGAALAAGHVLKMASWARYELTTLFAGYVDWFWAERLKNDRGPEKVFGEFCKTLLNSLQGSYGVKYGDWTPDPKMTWYSRWGFWKSYDAAARCFVEWRSRYGRCEFRKDKDNAKFALVALPAFITAHGRMMMKRLRAIAGQEQCFAQIGDALLVTDAGKDLLALAGELQPRELGKLRFKHAASWAELWNQAFFTLGGVTKYSVIGHTKQLSADGTYRRNHFERLDELLSRRPDDSVHVTTDVITPGKKYSRGRVRRDGHVERPHLVEIELPAVQRWRRLPDGTRKYFMAPPVQVRLPSVDLYSGPDETSE